MDDLFKRIETGQYVAHSTVFENPDGVMHRTTASALFGSEDDAALYARSVYKWFNSLFPATCVRGCVRATVVRELVSSDGIVIHGMSGRTWDLARVTVGARAFAEWKASLGGGRGAALADCERLARAMDLPFAHERRMRCLPCLRDVCCLLDCFMCFIPVSVPRCCGPAPPNAVADSGDQAEGFALPWTVR